MIGFICFVLLDEEEASSGILSGLTDFLLKDGAGRKVTGVLVGTCVFGALFSFVWLRMLKCFQDSPVKISLALYHLAVIGMAVWALSEDIQFVLYFYGFQLVVTDIVLYLQRENFPFSEAMCRIGVNA